MFLNNFSADKKFNVAFNTKESCKVIISQLLFKNYNCFEKNAYRQKTKSFKTIIKLKLFLTRGKCPSFLRELVNSHLYGSGKSNPYSLKIGKGGVHGGRK